MHRWHMKDIKIEIVNTLINKILKIESMNVYVYKMFFQLLHYV